MNRRPPYHGKTALILTKRDQTSLGILHFLRGYDRYTRGTQTGRERKGLVHRLWEGRKRCRIELGEGEGIRVLISVYLYNNISRQPPKATSFPLSPSSPSHPPLAISPHMNCPNHAASSCSLTGTAPTNELAPPDLPG